MVDHLVEARAPSTTAFDRKAWPAGFRAAMFAREDGYRALSRPGPRRDARARARRAPRSHGRVARPGSGPLSAGARSRRPHRRPDRSRPTFADSDRVGGARGASRAARVTPGGRLMVGDDGRSGATLTRGLRGLADRVDALSGTIVVSSPAGGPTAIRVRLPMVRVGSGNASSGAAPRSSG
jgi:hypothetical protein